MKPFFLTGRLYKVALEVHWSREAIGKESWRFKKQQGLGASPKGHGRTLPPHDSWKAPEIVFGGTQESPRHSESVLDCQEARLSRRLTKGSVSHIATTRQLEGAGPISGPGGVGERHWRYTGVSKTFGKRYSFASGKMKSAPHQRVSVT